MRGEGGVHSHAQGISRGGDKHLLKRLGKRTPGGIRADIIRLTKGGFGLSESPRLWYLRLRRGLLELGLRELKLSPGTFVFHAGGTLRGVLAVHVDDLRIAFDPQYEYILTELRKTFTFGDWKTALTETVKFCGRWEKQCSETFKVTVTWTATPTSYRILRNVGSEIANHSRMRRRSGWLRWEAKSIGWLVKDERTWLGASQRCESYQCVFQALPGGLDNMIFLAVSDASHGAMPKGRSQGGLMVLNAPEEILDGEAPVNCLLYHSAVLKRVVRSSLAAEISQAAEALEQCDFVRAMMAEIVDVKFTLGQWRWSASRWKEILVLDSKTGYDVLNSISHGEDKRLAIDIAILKESLYEPRCNRWVRWVPGMTMPADGLTKEYGNHARDIVMQGGPWSLRDSPAAQRLREEAGFRKKQCKERVRQREREFEQMRQADTSAPMGAGVETDM